MMAPRQVALPVRHFRAGRRTRVRLLVLHTAEGARTVASLAGFLNRIGIASYHASTEPSGLLAYYVNRRHEAWHVRGGNPMADGLCLTGFASWSHDEWMSHPAMLDTTAWWLASCARDRGLPLRKLTVPEVRDAVRDPTHPGGVCAHWDYTLATGDGTHWDVGSHFPWDHVINMAQRIRDGQPPPPTSARKGLFMHLTEAQERTILEMAEQYIGGKEGVRSAGPIRMELLEVLELLRSIAEPVDRAGDGQDGQTSLRAMVAWNDASHDQTRQEILGRLDDLATQIGTLRADLGGGDA